MCIRDSTLTEALAEWGPGALGRRAAGFPYFPLLIKLIDAKDRLSVQVHPDDAYAARVEGEYGKTEMWYVVDCEPGARLIYGCLLYTSGWPPMMTSTPNSHIFSATAVWFRLGVRKYS